MHRMKPLWLKRLLRRLAVRAFTRYTRYRGRHGLAAIQRDGDRLGRLHYRLRPFRRAHLKRQIARVLGTAPTDPALDRILKQAYRHNDRAALEIMALSSGGVTPGQVADSVTASGLEPLIRSLDSGRGAVLLGMHMGNALAFLVDLDRRGVPVSVIAFQSRKLPEGFFENMFTATGIERIQARPERVAYYHLRKALKQGRTVFIPMDQIHKVGGVPARFLDKQVTMPAGPAALARSLGVPVFPVFLDAAEPKWAFRVGEAIHLTGQQPLEADVAELTAVLDNHIRKRPELWTWHQRRWDRHPFEPPATASDRVA